jgi:hypothetical protein
MIPSGWPVMGVTRYKLGTFLCVIACLWRGSHLGADYGYFNIPPELTTYIRGTCKFGGIPTLQGPVYTQTLDYGTRAIYPFGQSPTMVDRWNFISFSYITRHI